MCCIKFSVEIVCYSFLCISCVDYMVENVWFSSGVGQPKFSSEDSCTYIFDWETQHACVEKPASCQLLAGPHLFDLSSLIRTSNMGMIQLHLFSVKITGS